MAWINGFQVWLTETQSLANAQQVVNFLYQPDKDWSKESISALVGNMRHESSINPNMYEYGYDESADRGFGLVQWTPRSKFWDWGVGAGYTEDQLRNGDSQLARIDYEVENNIQWIAKESVFDSLTFQEFRTNSRNLSVNDLTEAFTWGYERPNATAGAESMGDRQAFASRAFSELDWSGSTNPEPEPEPEPEPPEDTPDVPYDGIDLNSFGKELNELITTLLSGDVYKAGNSQFYQNESITMMKQLENTYKLKPNQNFYDAVNNKLKEFNDSYIPEEPTPDPTDPTDPTEPTDPVPTGEKRFPVRIENGINFYRRSDYGSGTLQRNMTYGVRSSGDNHFGYDIGGGGYPHVIYSVTDGEVVRANFANGIGNRVTIKNKNDNYFLEYGHLASFSVKVGDIVSAGDVLAVMGKTGGNYAVHLDLKIATAINGFYSWETTIDPEKYLGVTGDGQTTLSLP